MKLPILSLSLIATSLLAGCNPDPRPTTTPDGYATPVVDQPRSPADADNLVVFMNRVTSEEVGPRAGTITVRQSADGLVFTPNVMGLTEGKHGFHVHQNPSCEPAMKDDKKVAAAAAGGHYDPTNTGKHTGPHGDGHKGDLPMLHVDSNGIQQEVTISGLTLADLKNRSLVIHQRQDDYTSNPAGDSGPRIACGVVN